MKYFSVKRMFAAMSYITIAIAIIISISLFVSRVSKGWENEYLIPWYYFPGMVGAGAICGFFSELILPNKEVGKKEAVLRFCLHGCSMIVVVYGMGYCLNWFSASFYGVISAIVSVVIVYGFVFGMMKKKNEKIAEELNKGLKEKYQEKN